jgi:hypothetical protein
MGDLLLLLLLGSAVISQSAHCGHRLTHHGILTIHAHPALLGL